MESPSRFELTKAEVESGEETELGEVKVTPPTSTVATSTPVQPGAIPCRNGGCKSWTSRAESRMESPWHFLKTIFLISVIVALILWIIVYTALAQYRILWRGGEREDLWMVFRAPPSVETIFRENGRTIKSTLRRNVSSEILRKDQKREGRSSLCFFFSRCKTPRTNSPFPIDVSVLVRVIILCA